MHLLHDNQHVDIFQTTEPQFPTNEEEYSPVEFTQLHSLYFGSNTLLHFFEKEHDCCQHPHALSSIPKKLRGKLAVPNGGRPMVGWGMQLVDGVPGDGPATRLISRPATDFLACLAVTDYRDSPSNLSRYEVTV